MRRLAPLGLLLALSACGTTSDMTDMSVGNPFADYVGSPFTGMGGMIADTHTPFRHPNTPDATSPNMKRIAGQELAADPLMPEDGNVWPGQMKPQATLSDIAKSMDASTGSPARKPVGAKP